MSTRRSNLLQTVTTIFVAGLLVTLLIAAPAGAERSPIPNNPNVIDAAGDANRLYVTDQSTPTSRPEADILAAWFTADRKVLTVSWHMAASPVGQDLLLELNVNPNPDAAPVPDSVRLVHRAPCVNFAAFFPAGENADESQADATRSCPSVKYAIGELRVTEMRDGSVIVAATFRRTKQFILRSGDVLSSPWASVGEPVVLPALRFAIARIDTTQTGKEYRVP